MRIGAAVGRVVLGLIVVTSVACGGTGGALFRQYEYEEEIYLSLDGRATMYVNSSIPALNALRGTSFDARPTARVDRDAVRHYFTTPVTRVTRVSTSRRSGRTFVHVRIDVEDVRRLGETVPFGWSSYRLEQDGEVVVYRQQVGAPGTWALGTSSADISDQLVGFRIHIPSVVTYHNAGADNLRRGNILVWEQALGERLAGAPLEMEARMEPRSILYRTLLLFAAMGAGVALLFAVIVWAVVRKGRRAE